MKTIFRFRHLIMPLVFGVLILTSCNKDDENNNPSKTDLLTASSWVLKSLTVDPPYDWFGSGIPITNLYALLEACDKDDFTTFKKDGTATFNEGAEKCDSQAPQTRSGSWAFTNDETAITVTDEGEAERWELIKLTSTELVAEFSITDEGVAYTITSSFRYRKRFVFPK